jgi:excisionase family DNA binding protein
MIHTRLVYSVKEAAPLLGISLALCYRLISEGTLRSTLHKGCSDKMITAAELDRYVAEIDTVGEIAKGA